MADTVFPTELARERPRRRLRNLAKRLLQVVVSYEVATYGLATVQAMGLTLPTMVNPIPAAEASECRSHLQQVVNEAARFRVACPSVPLRSLQDGTGAAIVKGLPICPAGGRYELFPTGVPIRLENGTRIVPSEDLLAAHCVGEDGSELHPGIAIASAR